MKRTKNHNTVSHSDIVDLNHKAGWEWFGDLDDQPLATQATPVSAAQPTAATVHTQTVTQAAPVSVPAPIAPVAAMQASPVSVSAATQTTAQPLSVESVLQIFLNAKTESEIAGYASDCPVPVWLNWLIKLAPKRLDVDSRMDVRAIFATLGPVERSST